MTDPFQPGDIVECIDDRTPPNGWGPLTPPILSDLYTVTGVVLGRSDDGADDLGVALRELPVRSRHFYSASRFRKIYRPDAKLIERLTAEPLFTPPAKSPVKVDA